MTFSLQAAALGILFAIIAPSTTAAATRRPVSELVIDAASGRTLYAASPDLVRPPASLTKMMTLLLAFEAIDAGRLRGGDSIVMSAHAARQAPSRLGLAAGGRISVRAAIKTVAVISANDVAVALAERLNGSEAAFVRAMNRRAGQIGMAHTRFGNATGLPPGGGTTTARDMATLSRYLIRRFPAQYRVFSSRTIRWAKWVRPNHNRLLGKVAGVDGIKTGYTAAAGFNLAASGVRRGTRVIVVVLGADTVAARDLLVANLLESGFTTPTSRRAAQDSPVARRVRPAVRQARPLRTQR